MVPGSFTWHPLTAKRLLRLSDQASAQGQEPYVVFDRAKSLELIIWIAQHSATATRAGARAALWDLDVANASFSNVVSEARRALARAVPPPSGEDWILRTYAERLPLRAGIVLDADLVAAHLARARTLDGTAAINELRAGIFIA